MGQSSPVGSSTSSHYVDHGGFWNLFLGAISKPDLAVSTGTHDFGRVFLGQSASHRFTVSNRGTANLFIGDLTLSGADEYSLPASTDYCSGAALPPTGSCTFEVLFAPSLSSLGRKGATVSIPSNGADSPMAVEVQGRGVRLMVNP